MYYFIGFTPELQGHNKEKHKPVTIFVLTTKVWLKGQISPRKKDLTHIRTDAFVSLSEAKLKFPNEMSCVELYWWWCCCTGGSGVVLVVVLWWWWCCTGGGVVVVVVL